MKLMVRNDYGSQRVAMIFQLGHCRLGVLENQHWQGQTMLKLVRFV